MKMRKKAIGLKKVEILGGEGEQNVTHITSNQGFHPL